MTARIPPTVAAVMALGAFTGVWATWVAYGPDTPRLGGGDVMPVWISDLATGWIIQVAGFVAWLRVPASRIGALLVLTGIAWFAGNFAHSEMAGVAWLASQLVLLHRGPLVHALLTYPGGRASTPAERVGVALGYGAALLPAVWGDAIASVLVVAVTTGITLLGYGRAKGSLRRSRRLAAQVTVVLGSLVLLGVLTRMDAPANSMDKVATLVDEVALATAAAVLSWGLAALRRQPSGLTDFAVELGHGDLATLQDSMSRILGDRTLQVGYWLEGRSAYLTASGMRLDPPPTGSARAVTRVERDGQPVAILVHDAALLDEPDLIDAISTATRLGTSNDRLHAESRAQLAELEASRRRLILAADDERRRLEVRLRSGAQWQVESLGATLEVAMASAATSVSVPTMMAIQRAARQAERTLEDFQVLARGLHPGLLGEAGLAAALEELTGHGPVPVRLSVDVGPLHPTVAAATWFICSEALANVTKHARASSASLSVRAVNDNLLIEVVDDGTGGADLAGGSGLRGLADRVEALDGSFDMDSGPGLGTRLRVALPLGRHARLADETGPVASTDTAVVNTPAGTDGMPTQAPYGGATDPLQGARR